MVDKRWEVAPPIPPALQREYKKVSPIVAQLLYNRGLQTPEEAYHFLYDKAITTDPFKMKDMRRAVERIRTATKRRERIIVYGDFDADGVTSTTLMMQVLTRLKANVEAYIPHRVDEGYGLNSPALEKLAEDGAKVIITVDCGIRSVQEVEDGKAAGLDMIITDHHSVGPIIPDAYAVVNPQQEDCAGDKRLAGVGVAFMVARGLLLDAWERLGRKKEHLRIYAALTQELLDLVAIGTVADIMPINTPLNRSLVRRGLEVMNQANRPGLRALMQVAGLKKGEVTAMSIGFVIGPRLNAAGRLDSAMTAYQLLSAKDDDEAIDLAQHLQELNKQRQQLTREAQERIQYQIEGDGVEDAQLIFAVDDEVIPGIVGLVAGRLTEAYFRPAVVVEYGDEECHASCRSIPQFHITQALDECADLLVRHGGHAMAAGLTVLPENLPKLRDYLTSKAEAVLDGQELLPTIMIDMEIPLKQLTFNLAKDLEVLEPTGHDNRKPVFLSRNVQVVEKKPVGDKKAHLKLKLAADRVPPIDAIGFRLGRWLMDLPDCVDVVYELDVNVWQGRRNLQMNVLDIRPAEVI